MDRSDNFKGLWQRLKKHWALWLITLFAIIPLFVDLGGDYLWADEGDTAVLAENILKFGVPKAWDGTTFTDADLGARVNSKLMMVSHPWLQYYVTAGSFALFGKTTFAARFPFALAGLMTIVATYFLMIRLIQSRQAAIFTCILIVFSVQFFLFSRQCRNYSLNMLVICLLLLAFFRLTSFRGCLLFSGIAIVSFHCSPSACAPLAGLGLLTLFYRPFKAFRRWYWMGAPFIILFTVPWIFWAREGYNANTAPLEGAVSLLRRCVQFVIECASVTPLVGVIVMLLWAWWRGYRDFKKKNRPGLKFTFKQGRDISARIFAGGERNLIVVVGVVVICYGGLVLWTQSTMHMYNNGLRYMPVIIPLTAALAGALISKVSQGNARVWIPLLLLLCVTKLGRITPLAFGQPTNRFGTPRMIGGHHAPVDWDERFLKTSLISFARELWDQNHGTVSHICNFLKKNANPKEILITNYAADPIYFYTHMPQGLKIRSDFPAYEAARRLGLPEYVFSIEGVKWIVWRRSWDGYQDLWWKDLHQALEQAGARVQPVALIPETVWENRANVHFHRYPGDDHDYPWAKDPEAVIYRVKWEPENSAAAIDG